jgi:hypothetical protein
VGGLIKDNKTGIDSFGAVCASCPVCAALIMNDHPLPSARQNYLVIASLIEALTDTEGRTLGIGGESS